MTKRQARRHAHHVAYLWIQKAIDTGPGDTALTDEERLQIENELDKMAQRHFELGERRGE